MATYVIWLERVQYRTVEGRPPFIDFPNHVPFMDLVKIPYSEWNVCGLGAKVRQKRLIHGNFCLYHITPVSEIGIEFSKRAGRLN